MMAEGRDLSIITGLQGYENEYSLSQLRDYLKADLLSEEYRYGRVFWRPEPEGHQQSQYEVLYNNSNLISHEREIKERIRSALRAIASECFLYGRYLIQFWAAKEEGHEQGRGRHHYLTTADHPFSLGCLCKGLCWYRKRSMDHYCVVEEGAEEGQLGAVGRVYRNKHPESSPDLRLYSANEFPLRDQAARFGLRSYLALPVFDLINKEFFGVLEFLSLDTSNMQYTIPALYGGLQAAELRSTHTDFFPIDRESKYIKSMPSKYEQPLGEISKTLELAIKVVPQLHTAQVWVPCKQCANMSNNFICMERANLINVADGIINSSANIDPDMFEYLQACESHRNLQPVKENSNSSFFQNRCDYPLAHYAQKARLSIYFALHLPSVHDCNDIYVIDFLFQSICKEDACGSSFLRSLLRIMEMELKSFKFALEGQLRRELLVQSGQPNAIGYESTEYAQERKHQNLMGMEWHRERYSESDFTNYLPMDGLCCLRPSNERSSGWVFCSPGRGGLLEPNLIEEKIKSFMINIASILLSDSYSLVQYWAPKKEKGRCYLATSDQPFVLGCLAKGLALFRNQCMKHHYFVGRRANEEKLGPPGRVFQNGHPEITPDLCLYSIREFPLRNEAVHCRLRKYLALPVFDIHHKCVGVLEFVEFSDSTLKSFAKELEAADLSSAHIKFEPSSRARQVALSVAGAEITDALQLVSKIPQLYRAEVWIPYCQKLSCMELAFSTESKWGSNLPMYRIPHVQTKKGIAGMVLASENRSCFCRNSCHLSIVEQPLAHYVRRERLDVCFAICLQSSHTGNLHYVLEFFLIQGPSDYEYFWSSLSFLLSIMKEKLKSFKVASGQQLGQELVVKVITFSEANKLTFSELNQRDIFPFKFKTVHYGQKETDKGKRKHRLCLSHEEIQRRFGMKQDDAAKDLGVGRSTLKRACREIGIHRWPCNDKQRKNPSLFETKSANEIVRDYQTNTCPSSSRNHLLLETPLHQNVPQTNTESTQRSTVQPKAERVTAKVKYEDGIRKFHLCLSSGMDKILKDVAMRLNLEVGSFKLTYLDEENEEILLASDDDLQLCLESFIKGGKAYLLLCVQLNPK